MLSLRLHQLGKELEELKEQKIRIQANDPTLKQIDDLIKATKNSMGRLWMKA